MIFRICEHDCLLHLFYSVARFDMHGLTNPMVNANRASHVMQSSPMSEAGTCARCQGMKPIF